MVKVLIEFIGRIFQKKGIPYLIIIPPVRCLGAIDFGLREQILGVPEAAARFSKMLDEVPDHTVVHWTDSFRCHYTMFRWLNPGEIMFIGPTRFEKIGESFFEELFSRVGLPEQLKPSLHAYYHNIICLTDLIGWQDFCALIAEYIRGKDAYAIEHRNAANCQDDPLWQDYLETLAIPEHPLVNLRFIEEYHVAEQGLLLAMTTGNESLVIERAKILFDKELYPRLHSQMRDSRNQLISMDTMLRRQAESAGVHPVHIDSLSSSNIHKIEQLSSMEQIYKFRWEMLRGYCRLIREHAVSAYSMHVRKAITYIKTDLAADLSLKSISSQINVSPGYLSQLFSREVGVSLTKYVNHSRIEFAQYLLANTTLSLQSIAIRCGISDICYFNRMFKLVTGMTPKFYQETVRSERMPYRCTKDA